MGRSRLARGTVGRRFTLLYAAIFLASGAALLLLVNVFAAVKNTEPVPGQVPSAQTDLAAAQQQIHRLQEQLAQAESAQARRLLVGSLVALAVLAAASLLAGRLLAVRVLRPLRTITAATRNITADDLDRRLAVTGPEDEVKDLADTIDDLLARLEASFAAQRRFAADASHELRTPLATMRARLDVALAKPQPPPPQTVALAQRLRTDLDTVDHLLDGLLILARVQHGAFGDGATVRLDQVAEQALAARGPDIAARELAVDTTGLRPAPVEGSQALLSRLVGNLVDNAVAHNRDGGRIRVATSGGDPAGLVVESDGPVLEQAQVEQLGRPFRRLGAARTGSGGGSGLGLAIVAAVAQAHGGSLELRARPEGGLLATVTFAADRGGAA
ncbi:two-component sensor histidine kinase [Catellatospora sp. TT07R-123]|uniref:sensor histidine kinase n=1 Tax=Catellatospora sp. TT07R-123 TaxID=2733863 RepID=UPI001B2EC4A0|nr:ATP-binding protein [Catellatospora sp. TT07R-123]GHJ48059.1 two-component sensor histidine kinase [Catellatospora sp. TT07R-123]